MGSERMREFLLEIQTKLSSRPSSIEFEMAYQARAAIDRIKFAIKHAEQFAPRTEQMRELEFQLLDAPERLKKVDRRFQERSRLGTIDRYGTLRMARPAASGSGGPSEALNAFSAKAQAMASFAFEKHYRVKELAVIWGLSPKTVSRLFADEPGVIRVANDLTGKRKYATLSIPESVASRVHEQLDTPATGRAENHSAPVRIIRLRDTAPNAVRNGATLIKLRRH